MDVVEKPDAMRSRILEAGGENTRIGYVPTMGALHDGHRHVIRQATENNDRVAVSIFVNPTQFDTDEDAEVYPRQFEEDHEVLREEGVDFVFQPDHDVMYPAGDSTFVDVDLSLTDRYEGEIRPRFFRGVAQIVSKFFNIIPADHAYFGEKDLQQYLMLERMVRDLHFPQTLNPVPVARDEDGIAFSSRNQKFTDEDWETAARVYELMDELKDGADERGRSSLDEEYPPKFEEAGLDLQYLDVVGLPEYEPTSLTDPTAVLILAGYVGNVRLKDNLPLHFESVRAMKSEVNLLDR